MAHDVFVSYSNKDKVIADAICAKLEENNVRCWIAPRDVLPGMDYGDAIISAINGSEIVILAFSGNTNKSEHVKNEVERAASGGKTILPFRVENVLPSGSLALHLSRRHWLDALTPPLERHLKKLVETVRYLLSKEGREVEELPIEEVVKVPKKKPSIRDFLRPQWIMAGLAVVALFIIAIVFLLQRTGKDTFPISGAIDQTKQNQLTKPPVSPSKDYKSIEVSKSQLQCLTIHRDTVETAVFYPDGRRLLSSDLDGNVFMSDTKTGNLFGRLRDRIPYSASMSRGAIFSPDAQRAAAALDNQIIVWNVESIELVKRFEVEKGWFQCLEFSSDGRFLVAGGLDNLAHLWDLKTSQYIRQFKGHSDFVWDVDLSLDDRLLVSSSRDGTIRLWEVESGRQARTIIAGTPRYSVHMVKFSPDGNYVLSGENEGVMRLWDVNQGKEIRRFEGNEGDVLSVAFSPDGQRALSACSEGIVYLWDIRAGRQLQRFFGHTKPIRYVAFSPNGKRAVSCGLDKTIRIWKLPS